MCVHVHTGATKALVFGAFQSYKTAIRKIGMSENQISQISKKWVKSFKPTLRYS